MKKLITICLLAFIGITNLNAQWSELGGTNALAVKGTILAVCKDPSGNIYAAGQFTNSSSKYYVAKWNGSSWGELGGLNALAANNKINALCSDALGNIYATGGFTNSSGKFYVAKYNGNRWSELGGTNSLPANGYIIALCSDASGNIYASGGFTNSSGKAYVAKYNGSSWSELGGTNALNANSVINALCSDVSGNIYAAGDFSNSSNQKYVAKYNGSSWNELGGANALKIGTLPIYSICSDALGNIYAAGTFINSSFKRYVAKFNGSSWSELGGINALAANTTIYSICSDASSNIYAAGQFINSNGKQYVAKYDGNSWTELGGVNTFAGNSIIFSIYSDAYGNIHAGGQFTNSSNKNYVAKFAAPCTPTSSNFTISACSSYTWAAKGNKVYIANNNTDTVHLTNVGGCDSLVTLNLTINTPTSSTFTASACGNYTWAAKGNKVYTASNNTDTIKLKNAAGCDSIVTLNLTIKQPTSSTFTTSACGSYIWAAKGNKVYTASNNTDTIKLKNAAGCDSIVTLNLTITTPSPTNVSVVASATNVCAGTPVTFTATSSNGGTAPVYQWKKNGVDVGTGSSITFTGGTLNNNDSVWCVLTSNSTCVSGSSTVSSNKVKMIIKSSPASFTINSANLLSCTIGSSVNVTTNAWNTAWQSSDTNVATVTYPGTSGSNSGAVKSKTNGTTMLYCTIIGANGCTNTQSVVFKVDAVTPAIINGASSGCLGGTITLTPNVAGGVWTSNSAAAPVTGGVVSCNGVSTPTISYKLTNSSNCSATTTKALTINNKPIAPSLAYATGTVMGSIRSGANFCNNRSFTLVGTPAGGSWSSSNPTVATVSNAGVVNTVGLGTANITYTITNAAGCTNSSSGLGTVVACSPRGVSLTKDPMPNAFTIYPNPSTGVFNIKVEKFKAGDKIVITDILGKVVIEQNINSQLSTINSTLTKGMYLVSVITEGGKETKKVVIE